MKLFAPILRSISPDRQRNRFRFLPAEWITMLDFLIAGCNGFLSARFRNGGSRPCRCRTVEKPMGCGLLKAFYDSTHAYGSLDGALPGICADEVVTRLPARP